MFIVVERGDTGSLRRPGHHHADVLAHLLEVADELGITGIEADPDAGKIRTLRQRVHRHEPVEARLQDRAPATRST